MGEPVAVAETPEVVNPLGRKPVDAEGAMMVELPAPYGALVVTLPVAVAVAEAEPEAEVETEPVVEADADADVEAEMLPAVEGLARM